MKNYFHKSGFGWFGGEKGASETLTACATRNFACVCLCARGARQPTCARVLTFHFFCINQRSGEGRRYR